MRNGSVLPRRWTESYSADNDRHQWKMQEDIEILQWHVWGRNYIDAQVFFATNRSGQGVTRRANYLCQDGSLVAAVKQAEEQVRDKESTDADRAAKRAIAAAIRQSLDHRTS